VVLAAPSQVLTAMQPDPSSDVELVDRSDQLPPEVATFLGLMLRRLAYKTATYCRFGRQTPERV